MHMPAEVMSELLARRREINLLPFAVRATKLIDLAQIAKLIAYVKGA